MDQRDQNLPTRSFSFARLTRRARTTLQAAAKSMGVALRAMGWWIAAEKTRVIDLNVARFRLADRWRQESSVEAPHTDLCKRISELEARMAQAKSRAWLATGASWRERIKVFGSNVSGWLVSQGLRIKGAVLLIKLGAALEKQGGTTLPQAEIAGVNAVREKIGSMKSARRDLSRTGEVGKGFLWLVGIGLIILSIAILTDSSRSLRKRPEMQSHPARANAPSELASQSKVAGASAAEKDVQSWLDDGASCLRKGDMNGAFSNFMRAAQRGHGGGQLQVGWHFENGAGVSRDYISAAKWYRKSAEQGSARAMKNLGQLYENGVGVPEDWEAAAAWYRKGAEMNEPDAEAALGRAYQFGIGVPQNRAVSIYWNERALAHGDQSSEQWVRWLRDPTNNVGFRNPEEQSFVLGNQMRTSGLLLGADPAGILFKDSSERTAWLRGLRKAVDRDEEEARRRLAEYERQQTENSKRRHESEVQRLQAQGYSREAAESSAGW